MPATFAFAVFGTFALVAIVFFLYDWLVQRRNKELAATAARSDKVIASLFPSEMKDMVLAQQTVAGKSGHFKQEEVARKGTRMAKEYAQTTIFFGDLSGFTAWSAKRTPDEVFELLETCYKSFDTIAKRRCVFKVETIGDCYGALMDELCQDMAILQALTFTSLPSILVAATGLPDPQKDHALRMTRFANDCMQRMNILTAELSETLGPDTAHLKLRVGLHSGKITGGVLKGDKSRFQLFGDTMNTASRMESNGVPGRIHLSGDTAKELAKAGKGDWLVPREDKIVAKGKGELSTFFALVPDSSAAMTRSSVHSGDSESLPVLSDHFANEDVSSLGGDYAAVCGVSSSREEWERNVSREALVIPTYIYINIFYFE